MRAFVYSTQRIEPPTAHDGHKITITTHRVLCPTANDVPGVRHWSRRGSVFLGGATKRRYLCTTIHFGSCTAGADRPTAPCKDWFNAGRRESQEEGGWRRGSTSSQRRNTLRGRARRKKKTTSWWFWKTTSLRQASFHAINIYKSFVRANGQRLPQAVQPSYVIVNIRNHSLLRLLRMSRPADAQHSAGICRGLLCPCCGGSRLTCQKW